MDVNHLEPDELEYELKLRKLRYTKRSQSISPLRSLVAREARGEVPKPSGIPPISDLAVERDICMKKAETLHMLVNIAIAARNQGELKWLKSRLIHFLNRISLLAKADPTAAEDVAEMGDSLKRKLDKVIEEITNGNDAGAVGNSPLRLEAIREFNEEGEAPISVPDTCQSVEIISSVAAMTSNLSTSLTGLTYTTPTCRAPILSTEPYLLPSSRPSSTSTNSKGAIPKILGTNHGRNNLSQSSNFDVLCSSVEPAYLPSHDSQFVERANQSLLNPRGSHTYTDSYSEPAPRISRPNEFATHSVENRSATSMSAAGERNDNRETWLIAGNRETLGPKSSDLGMPSGNRYGNQLPPPHHQEPSHQFHAQPAYMRPPPPYAQQQEYNAAILQQQGFPLEQNMPMRRNGGNPVSNWQIKFDGSPRSLTVDDFLFRVETLARADGVAQNSLVYAIHQLLSGRASTWYWQFCRKVPRATWYQLSYSLRREFEDQTTDYEIKRLMESRKQRPRESFGDFRLELEGLALRLREPMNPGELLEMMKRNMHPALRKTLILRDFNNVDEMDRLCRQVEKLWSEVGETAEDQLKTRRFNLHEVGYEDFKPTELQENRDPWEHEVMEVSKGNSNPYLICWNCDDIGHTFKYCPNNTGRVFCYTCGAKNVIRPNCFRCAKGNMKAGQGLRGPQNPQILTFTPQPKQRKVDQATMTERPPYSPMPRTTR